MVLFAHFIGILYNISHLLKASNTPIRQLKSHFPFIIPSDNLPLSCFSYIPKYPQY